MELDQKLEEVVRIRMERENVNSGELHASLIWNDIADLDLHVITPSNEHIYFGHKESKCGGWLDVDMNAPSSKISLEPIENIFWASSPSGSFEFYVHNYNNRTDDNTVFTDSNRKVPFRVRLKRGDKIEWFEGSAGPNEKVTCFKFDNVGSGAIGSFVVVPPSNTDSTFAELCQKSGVPYIKGNGYYALKRTEAVSAKKEMILHNKENDTFIITSNECRTILGLPHNQDVKIKPKDVPEKYRLFIQSTSHNRKIPKDTHVLCSVSVRDALKYRLANRYNLV